MDETLTRVTIGHAGTTQGLLERSQLFLCALRRPRQNMCVGTM